MASSGHGVDLVRDLIGGEHHKLISGAIAVAVLALLGFIARRQLKSHPNPLIPDSRLGILLVFELIAEFLTRLGDNVMGQENRKYLPFIATLFVYILFMNLMGLVPGFSGPTDNMAFNAGLAVTVFTAYTIWGIKEVGVVGYFKHMAGPAFFSLTFSFSWQGLFFVFVFLFEMAIHVFILGVELISHLFRPVSLSLRLYGNMSADHALLSVFTEMTKVGIPVIFYLLGIFVSFMQAFVFSMLTMIYIRFAVAHEEGEEH